MYNLALTSTWTTSIPGFYGSDVLAGDAGTSSGNLNLAPVALGSNTLWLYNNTAQTGKSNVFTAVQTIDLNTLNPPPAAPAGTILQLAQANSVAARVATQAFGATAYYSACAYGGTAAAPTQVTSGSEIGGFNVWGYSSEGALEGPLASFRTFAGENLASGHHGAYADVAVTPTGSTTLTQAVQFGSTSVGGGGLLVPGTVTGGDKGPGTLNAVGLYIAGVAVVAGAFVNPMTALGDTIYGGNSPAGAATRLAGSTAATTAILTQTGSGSASAAPVWSGTTGTLGGVMLSQSPTTTGTLTAAIVNASGLVTASAGLTVSQSALTLSGNISAAGWTTAGLVIVGGGGTYTDTSGTGTVANQYTAVYSGGTVVSSNVVTYTNYEAFHFVAPAAGTNVNITNAYAAGFNGNIRLQGGGIRFTGNISQPAWTTAGIVYVGNAAVVTDTTSSGTVTEVSLLTQPTITIAASTATTYTQAETWRIVAPTSGTNVTIGYPVAASLVGGGLVMSSGFSAASWTTFGVVIRQNAATYTDTTGSGTIAEVAISSMGQPTYAASSAVTATLLETLRIVDPVAGTNVILGTGVSLNVGGLKTRAIYIDGSVIYASFSAGGSTTLSSTIKKLINYNTSTIATYTLVTPTSPADGQELFFQSCGTITALTLSASAGQSVVSSVTGLVATGGAAKLLFSYRASNTTWYVS